MGRLGSHLILLLALIVCLVTFSHTASAQSLRLRSNSPTLTDSDDPPPWDGFIRYSVVTDYADTNTPRDYENALLGQVAYHLDKQWSLSLLAGVHADLFDGQIDKEAQQTQTEAVNPSAMFELDYDSKVYGNTEINFNLHGEPLWDQASELEGYKGIVGTGGSLAFHFFGKIYTLANMIDVSELLNTFSTAADETPNPDYFVTYRLGNTFRFLENYKFTYLFGLKSTRYMDGFWGYEYNNVFSLSRSWGKLTVGLAYEDGGFTDDGEVRLWYIDQYRRIAHLTLSYAF